MMKKRKPGLLTVDGRFVYQGEAVTGVKMIVAHLYLGIPIVLAYIWLAPVAVAMGFPSLFVLLVCEITVMPLFILAHLRMASARLGGKPGFLAAIHWGQRSTTKRLVWQVLACIAVILIFYGPAYALGLTLRETLFAWLPDWYFDPGFDSAVPRLLIVTAALAIVSDGIVAPVLEELYFRGYLLPRMAHLKAWAPVVNAALFSLYHFWQPHNLLGLFIVSLVISYSVWKTNNLRLGIAIHCTLNLLSSLGVLAYVGQ